MSDRRQVLQRWKKRLKFPFPLKYPAILLGSEWRCWFVLLSMLFDRHESVEMLSDPKDSPWFLEGDLWLHYEYLKPSQNFPALFDHAFFGWSQKLTFLFQEQLFLGSLFETLETAAAPLLLIDKETASIMSFDPDKWLLLIPMSFDQKTKPRKCHCQTPLRDDSSYLVP